MHSKSVFLNVSKVVDLRWKNPDVSRIQGVRHVIYVFVGSSLLGITGASFIIVGYVW